jgi:hypothetical protein
LQLKQERPLESDLTLSARGYWPALAVEKKRAYKRYLRSPWRKADHGCDAADHACGAADHATDDTTYDTADHGANRTGDLPTRGYALLASADDALCMRGDGRRKRGNNDG